MMRGTTAYATAIRDPEGNIVVESKRLPPPKWWMKVPFLRGFLNFFSMMVSGMRITMRSAEVYGQELEEEQPNKFEKWLAKTLHINVMDIAMFVGIVLGVALAVGLFIVLPKVIVDAINNHAMPEGQTLATIFKNLIEGGIRLFLFVMYLSVISLMKDIRRLFMYHGAEHKTISCYEHGLPLTVENARAMSKHHDRCGTNFMVITLIISILIFSLVEWILELCGWNISQYGKVPASLIGIAIRLALLPLVAGTSYEVLKFLAKFDNWFVRILKAPGMAVQLLTTRVPDDSMLEVAIKAFETAQALDADPNMETTTFQIKKSYSRCRHEMEAILDKVEDNQVVADWIMVDVLGLSRSELPLVKTIPEKAYEKAIDLAKKVAEGRPLQYVLGKAAFYGRDFLVDSRVLIPRPETEQVVEAALPLIEEGARVLDLCTGSGAIAVTVRLESKAGEVVASDVSKDAVNAASVNAKRLSADVQFVQSDLFDKIEGDFDVIVSNPPYVSKKDMEALSPVVKKEPYNALFGGVDGLDFYRRIIPQAPLKAGGKLVLEIGYDQGPAVKELMEQNGYQDVQVLPDLEGHDRIVLGSK